MIILTKLMLFFSCSMLGMWFSTQWVASSFRYRVAILGEPLLHLGHVGIYKPWSLLPWMVQWSDLYPAAFKVQMVPCLTGIVLGTLLAILASVWVRINKNGLTTHGSARWAFQKEVEKSGLLARDGVLLGLTYDKSRYLRHDGPEHLCAFAPTRSGKGVGLVIPTLISWTDSVVCFDPKGENWKLTSGFRNKLGRCIYFDPTSSKSARFNPLSEIRKGDCEVKDAQNIADMLVDPDGSQQHRSHWERTAHSLLVGAILHVVYVEQDQTLSGLAWFLSHPERTFQETLSMMLGTCHLGDRVHPVVASSARELLNKAPEELSGVLSTAISFLSLYRDPMVARATSTSDFKISDLMSDKRPVSLYLVVPPSDITRTKALMRLILNQIGRVLTESLEPRPHRLLWLLDEFPALGKLDFFESALAYMAGYGMKCFLITQSLNQLDAIYGPNNSILDNCHIKIAFASNDERTAKRISDLLGQKTELKQQKSISGKRLSGFMDHSSVSFQEFSRPLLMPSEIMQLSHKDEIVFVAGFPPILAKKLRYYDDPKLLERVLKPPPLEKTEAGGPIQDDPTQIKNQSLKKGWL